MNVKPISHYYLAFNQIGSIGPATFKRVLTQFGSIEKLFHAPSEILSRTWLKPKQIATIKQFDWKQIEESLDWCEIENHHLITWDDDHYPLQLKQIAHPPPCLFVIGQPAKLSPPQIAMVGSRRPTLIGYENSRYFATQLARHELIITSGLAIGIDGAAHQAVLDINGYTIAVLGSGIDYIYPTKHRKLAQAIADNGAIVSEFPLGTPPLAKNFPRRNRIISGLSLGTLVVEAAIRSGSLLSANYAVEQGREVFAIPGSIHNPLIRGCHHLIQQGAKLVQTTDDIIEELAQIDPMQLHLPVSDETDQQVLPTLVDHGKTVSLSTEESRLLAAIDEAATPFNTIMERTGFTLQQTNCHLLTLQLHGLIAAVTGGYCKTSC